MTNIKFSMSHNDLIESHIPVRCIVYFNQVVLLDKLENIFFYFYKVRSDIQFIVQIVILTKKYFDTLQKFLFTQNQLKIQFQNSTKIY